MKLKFTELQNRFQSFWFFFQNQYFETMTGQLKNYFHDQTRVSGKNFLVKRWCMVMQHKNGGNFQMHQSFYFQKQVQRSRNKFFNLLRFWNNRVEDKHCQNYWKNGNKAIHIWRFCRINIINHQISTFRKHFWSLLLWKINCFQT